MRKFDGDGADDTIETPHALPMTGTETAIKTREGPSSSHRLGSQHACELRRQAARESRGPDDTACTTRKRWRTRWPWTERVLRAVERKFGEDVASRSAVG